MPEEAKAMLKAWSQHWPEYLAEAAGLGLFMISACVFVAMLEYEGSWLRHGIEDPAVRRLLIGIAMGSTAIAVIYSPWGKRSGAHLNPAVTLTFLRLGMSMNPARTFGSALPAHAWTGLWIYFTAPPLGMLLAAELYLRTKGAASILCCKLHHENNERCIFRCRYPHTMG